MVKKSQTVLWGENFFGDQVFLSSETFEVSHGEPGTERVKENSLLSSYQLKFDSEINTIGFGPQKQKIINAREKNPSLERDRSPWAHHKRFSESEIDHSFNWIQLNRNFEQIWASLWALSPMKRLHHRFRPFKMDDFQVWTRQIGDPSGVSTQNKQTQWRELKRRKSTK